MHFVILQKSLESFLSCSNSINPFKILRQFQNLPFTEFPWRGWLMSSAAICFCSTCSNYERRCWVVLLRIVERREWKTEYQLSHIPLICQLWNRTHWTIDQLRQNYMPILTQRPNSLHKPQLESLLDQVSPQTADSFGGSVKQILK